MKTAEIMKNFASNPKGYGFIPFWFWNDELQEDHLIYQMDEMKDKGIDEFLIHARLGLKVPYLSELWFQKVEFALKEAQKRNMQVWIYDEENWPSGYAGERVLNENPDYCGKYLRRVIKGEVVPGDHKLVYEKDGYGYWQGYCHWNPAYSKSYYTDMLSKEATECFVKCTHAEYFKRFSEYFGNIIKGFFVDEPGFYNNFPVYSPRDDENTVVWNEKFPEFFMQYKGYNIFDYVDLLWKNDSEISTHVKKDFYEAAGAMYRQNYLGVMRDFCDSHNIKLIGHIHTEEFMPYHVRTQGEMIKTLSVLHYSGVDRIDLNDEKLSEKYGSSAQHIYGLDRTLSETFCFSGWDNNLSKMKYWLDYQFAKGINLIVPHAFYSSIEGERKWECPPSLFYQNYYWKYFKNLSDYVRRMSYILSQGSHVCDIGVYYPISTQYELIWPDDLEKAVNHDKFMIDVCYKLAEHQLDYDILNDDAILMSQIEEGKMLLHSERYKVIILPAVKNLKKDIYLKLVDFAIGGGAVILLESDKITVLGDIGEKLSAEDLYKAPNFYKFTGFHMNKPYTYQFDPDKLRDILTKHNAIDVKLSVPDKTIKILHREFDNTHLFLLHNEENKEKEVEFACAIKGVAYILNAFDGSFEKAAISYDNANSYVKVYVECQQAVLILITDLSLEGSKSQKSLNHSNYNTINILILHNNWLVTIDNSSKIRQLDFWSRYGYPHYSGHAVYENEINLKTDSQSRYMIETGEIYASAEIYINDEIAGTLTWAPWQLEITKFIKDGTNKIKLVISNTLGNELEKRDYLSGFRGPVKIAEYKNS